LHPASQRAAVIRSRIEATVRRAPQVMVKVTGGGRGTAAVAAHLRSITKNGRLDIEDDRGVVGHGKDRCATSNANGASAGPTSLTKATAARPSTSCCR
jgi:hypothetical protein